MTRVTAGILAVVIGAAAFVYFSWAAQRIGFDAFRDPGWPRASPYPDRWLLTLNDYYDAKYPATSGIKLHGELARVRRDVTWASRAGAVMCAGGILILGLPAVLRWSRSRSRGFDVVDRSGPAADSSDTASERGDDPWRRVR